MCSTWTIVRTCTERADAVDHEVSDEPGHVAIDEWHSTTEQPYHMKMAQPHGEVHHMKLTDSGQVSVPASIRRRWATRSVRITDAGDHLIVEPESENPFEAVRGVLGDLAVTGDEMRRLSREDEITAEASKGQR